MMNLEALKRSFYDVFGRQMPQSIVSAVSERLINDPDELAYSYYEYALKETAKAPRPSWNYTEAIVRRLYREKVPFVDLMFR